MIISLNAYSVQVGNGGLKELNEFRLIAKKFPSFAKYSPYKNKIENILLGNKSNPNIKPHAVVPAEKIKCGNLGGVGYAACSKKLKLDSNKFQYVTYLDLKQWNNYTCYEKYELTLHEIFTLIGVEETGNQELSAKYIRKLKNLSENLINCEDEEEAMDKFFTSTFEQSEYLAYFGLENHNGRTEYDINLLTDYFGYLAKGKPFSIHYISDYIFQSYTSKEVIDNLLENAKNHNLIKFINYGKTFTQEISKESILSLKVDDQIEGPSCYLHNIEMYMEKGFSNSPEKKLTIRPLGSRYENLDYNAAGGISYVVNGPSGRFIYPDGHTSSVFSLMSDEHISKLCILSTNKLKSIFHNQWPQINFKGDFDSYEKFSINRSSKIEYLKYRFPNPVNIFMISTKSNESELEFIKNESVVNIKITGEVIIHLSSNHQKKYNPFHSISCKLTSDACSLENGEGKRIDIPRGISVDATLLNDLLGYSLLSF